MVPDFESDAAAIAQYEEALHREERVAIEEAEREVRATYTRRHAAVVAEIASAAGALEDCRKRAEAALHAYGQRYPKLVHGSQIQKPSFWQVLFSFGGAIRLYNAAAKTVEETLEAHAAYRRKQRAQEELETWLAHSLSRAASDVREKMQAQEWLDKFRAQPDVQPLWTRVESIRAEREDYERRLQAGEVPPLEQRARFMAENKLPPLRTPAESIVIESILQFGDISSWIFVDAAGNKFCLPYDRRLENLIDWAFDTYDMAGRLEVKFSRLEDGRRISSLDQYKLRFSEESEAHGNWRARNTELRLQMQTAGEGGIDDPDEKRLLDLLASLVAAVV
jgi:hypothetical protein